METGVVNEESLSGLLRNLSQRRRNGALEIAYPEFQISLLFNKGKVVDVTHSRMGACEEVLQLLKDAGKVPADCAIVADSYSDLFRQLNNAVPIEEDLFRRVVKHRVLNQLYNLDLSTGAYFVFKVQMVEADHVFAPAVSAGQLLLDYVALESDAERFKATFPLDRVVARGEQPGTLSEEENAVWDALESPLGIEELKCKALLSRFHLQDALLAMFERGAVTVQQTTASPSREGGTEVGLADDTLGVRLQEALSGATAVAEAELAAPMVESDAEEDSELYTGPSLRVKLIAKSTQMLQANWVPNVVIAAFLLAALGLPLWIWPRMMSGF